MQNDSSIALKNLLAEVAALAKAGNSEQIADVGCIEYAQELGCDVATGATFTKLIFAIEAEIAKQNTEN